MTETLSPHLSSVPTHLLGILPDPDGQFNELKATSRRMCATAVDATDIAVMLETSGITDAIAGDRYGAPSTQDLAERLLTEVPTHATALVLAPEESGARDHCSGRLIRRGVLYAAPGAFYLAIATDFSSERAGLAVVGATVTGWMISQIIGLLAHRLTARTGPANTHAVLRRCLMSSAPIAAALAMVSEPLIGTIAAMVLAAQVIFAAAAAVLLFYDADRALMYCVIPGATVAVACAIGLSDRWPVWLPALATAVAAAITALVTVAVAWWVRSAESAAGDPASVQSPTVRELVGALPYMLYGLLCAVALISGPLIDMMQINSGVRMSESGLVVLPIVLGMGYGELEIRRLRATCQFHASLSTTMHQYRRRASVDLLRLEMRMATAFIVTTLVTTIAIRAASGQDTFAVGYIAQSGANIALGCALIAGLVGCAFARPLRIAAAFVITFGVVAVAALVASPQDLLTPAGYSAACVLLLILVSFAAARVVQNPITVIG